MCGACNYCKYMYTQKNTILPNGQIFHPNIFQTTELLELYIFCDAIVAASISEKQNLRFGGGHTGILKYAGMHSRSASWFDMPR